MIVLSGLFRLIFWWVASAFIVGGVFGPFLGLGRFSPETFRNDITTLAFYWQFYLWTRFCNNIVSKSRSEVTVFFGQLPNDLEPF